MPTDGITVRRKSRALFQQHRPNPDILSFLKPSPSLILGVRWGRLLLSDFVRAPPALLAAALRDRRRQHFLTGDTHGTSRFSGANCSRRLCKLWLRKFSI